MRERGTQLGSFPVSFKAGRENNSQRKLRKTRLARIRT